MGGAMSEETAKETEFEMLRAEIRALRQSVWHIEQMALSQTAASQDGQGKPQSVVVANVNIGFWAMVNLLVTAALAAIPAMIILFLVGLIFWGVLGAIFRGIVGG